MEGFIGVGAGVTDGGIGRGDVDEVAVVFG